jgi:hypothetical protein
MIVRNRSPVLPRADVAGKCEPCVGCRFGAPPGCSGVVPRPWLVANIMDAVGRSPPPGRPRRAANPRTSPAGPQPPTRGRLRSLFNLASNPLAEVD